MDNESEQNILSVRIPEKLSIERYYFKDIDFELQNVIFAKNCLCMARSLHKSDNPHLKLIATSLYATAIIIFENINNR